MHAHFEFVGGALCLDFANALNRLFGSLSGTEAVPEDPFRRILLWYEERGEPALPARELEGEALRKPAAARAVARRGKALSQALRDVFAAAGNQTAPPAAALRVLQREIQKAGKVAELLPVPGEGGWRWQDPPHRLDSVLGPVARSAADLLLSGRAREVKTCAGETCRWMFLDESRNQARKWCDMKACGNRSKVRRYRSRNP